MKTRLTRVTTAATSWSLGRSVHNKAGHGSRSGEPVFGFVLLEESVMAAGADCLRTGGNRYDSAVATFTPFCFRESQGDRKNDGRIQSNGLVARVGRRLSPHHPVGRAGRPGSWLRLD